MQNSFASGNITQKTIEKSAFFEFFYCIESENMINFENKESYDIHDFRRILELLRGEGGCPWDAQQTHVSIRRNMLEEAYEAVAAIDSGDRDNLLEELGDVQMQVLFHARMEEEVGSFNFDDVCDAACRKLLFRHPHVFGDVTATNAQEALSAWDDMKRKEKSQKTTAKAMTDVAETLPALWRAEKIQNKARKVGFDWADWTGPRAKIAEELAELDEAIESGGDVAGELGDLLAACVNLARFLDVDPEQALHGSCERFVTRFDFMEKEAARQGKELETMTLEEQEELWQQAKGQK